jgi:hypothetical protein
MDRLASSVVWLGVLALFGGCARGAAPPRAPAATPTAAAHALTSDDPSTVPPALLLGAFEDDYGNRFSITRDVWTQHPRTRYLVTRWRPAGQYVIARNDFSNPSDGGSWTRIDWMPLTGYPPYRWAFCLSAYRAPSAESAESTAIADRSAPRTGCGGHPFSRMRPVESSR